MNGVCAARVRWQHRGLAVAVVLIVLLAAGVRAYRLGTQSLAHDEASTFALAKLPVLDSVRASLAVADRPTYPLLMRMVVALRDHERALRAPSAIFGVLSVAAAMLLAWIAAGPRPALAAGLLLALCPLHVRYSQEARVYTMVSFAAAIAMCGVLWLLAPFARWAGPSQAANAKLSEWAAWIAFVVGSTSALYLHSAGGLVLAACSACAMLHLAVDKQRRGPLLRKWAVAHAAVFVLGIPGVLYLAQQARLAPDSVRPEVPTLPERLETLSRLYLYDVVGQPAVGALLVVCFGLGIVALRRTRALALYALLVLALLPPVIALLPSEHLPAFTTRNLSWVATPFYAVAAAGIFALRRRWAAPLALLLVMTGGAVCLRDHYFESGVHPPFRLVARVLSRAYDNDSVVFVAGSQERTTLNYYFSRRYKPVPRVPIYAVQPSQVGAYLEGAQSAWLLDGAHVNARVTGHLRAELGRHGQVADQQTHGDLTLLKYHLEEPEPPARGGALPR